MCVFAVQPDLSRSKAGFEVIKLEYSLKLKRKHNDWLLADRFPLAANHCALYKFENELKFYNLGARFAFNKSQLGKKTNIKILIYLEGVLLSLLLL